MQKTYKILLSAYACEPNKGSEPGVGWNWSLELSKMGHSVWVLTRSNNKPTIDDFFKIEKKPNNLIFIYYDLPKFLLFLKKSGMSVNIYYLLWQIGIVKQVKKIHNQIGFELIHHITFGVFRHPTFLYRLNIPVVFGPVGGGEYTPKSLKFSFPFKYQILEFIRRWFNNLSKYNPFLNKLYRNSALILTKTSQTFSCIPERYHFKTRNYLEIGVQEVLDNRKSTDSQLFRVLFVGRLVYWKGLDVAIGAFAKFIGNSEARAEFILIGDGDYKKRIRSLAKKFEIEDVIKLIDWIPQYELKSYYEGSNVLLFPSLHDSSGNVVLEALSNGLPVVCLDCGGPAAVLGSQLNELMVLTNNCAKTEIEDAIASKLELLYRDVNYYKRMSDLALLRARELTWSNTVRNGYDQIFKLSSF